MEVLLVEKDPLIRDQIKMGLQQFPEFEVTVGSGQAGINQMRGRHFGCVFLGVDPRQKDTVKLLHHVRQVDQAAELFVMTASKNVRDMQLEKSKFDIHSFLQTPLDLKEFFGLVGRFLERHTERQNSALRKQRGRAEARL
ncbi:MAG: hypothetical protein KDE27_21015 [Planctomycetes bacterium]|nr:hypothetical protein [Planctomycetota bacterium]